MHNAKVEHVHVGFESAYEQELRVRVEGGVVIETRPLLQHSVMAPHKIDL